MVAAPARAGHGFCFVLRKLYYPFSNSQPQKRFFFDFFAAKRGQRASGGIPCASEGKRFQRSSC
jgi:hypothetical protein